MSTLTQKLKRNAYGAAAILLTAAITIPNVLVGTASAAQVTERSIQMSSSAANASGVEYTINFTPATTATIEAIVVDFCSDSPIMGLACTAPSGFAVGGVVESASHGGTVTASSMNTNRTLVLTAGTPAALSSSTDVSIAVSGFVNPSAVDTFYARILTYTDADDVAAYSATQTESTTASTDMGGVALSTANPINVSATVQESLTFCVSGTAISGDECSVGVTAPNLTLGTGSPAVLGSTLSTANAYFQLSTNAANDTAIFMKNGAASGGLNSGTNSIAPVGSTAAAIATGAGQFGMRFAAQGSGITANPLYADANTSNYGMHQANVTSTYGDEIGTFTGPIANSNSELQFAANASPTTPAGIYTAEIVLIATSSY